MRHLFRISPQISSFFVGVVEAVVLWTIFVRANILPMARAAHDAAGRAGSLRALVDRSAFRVALSPS